MSLTPEQDMALKQHVFQHLYATALCVLGSQEAIDAHGMSCQFEDTDGTWWTFTVIPAPTEKDPA